MNQPSGLSAMLEKAATEAGDETDVYEGVVRSECPKCGKAQPESWRRAGNRGLRV